MTFSFTPVFLRSLLSQERHFLSTAGDYRLVGSAIFDPRERTVSRLLRRLRQPPSQTWKTFLHNHIGQMVSTDFFTVPPITMKVLFVFLVLEQDRRKVLHFNVTEHPTGPAGHKSGFSQHGSAVGRIHMPSDPLARS